MIDAFLIFGAVIVLGYLSLIAAEKYRISQVILLMLFGIFIGPVFNLVDISEESIARSIYPFMATLALIILLFDGGLSFNIFNIFKTITKSTVYTFAVFFLTIIFSLSLSFLINVPYMEAILLGTILAGTSSAIVIAMVERTKVNEDTKSLLKIESIITDSLVIIFVFVFIAAMKTENLALNGLLNSIFGTFSISIVFGLVSAFLWNAFLQNAIKRELDYMMTVGVLFIVYSLVQLIGGNGGLAIFVFGLVFANQKNIPASFLSSSHYNIDEKIRNFQGEVTFFTRTFFFVYIGILFPLEKISLYIIGVSFFIVGFSFLARYICAKYLLNNGESEKYDKKLIVPMMPRGLAAAVMVGILMSNGVQVPNLETLVFSVIFLTNVIATYSIYKYEKNIESEEISESDGNMEEDAKKTKKNKQSAPGKI